MTTTEIKPLARYLGAAGAVIELHEKPNEIVGTCNGCLTGEQRFSFDRMEGYVRRQADAWAQEHSLKCRAMARPTT